MQVSVSIHFVTVIYLQILWRPVLITLAGLISAWPWGPVSLSPQLLISPRLVCYIVKRWLVQGSEIGYRVGLSPETLKSMALSTDRSVDPPTLPMFTSLLHLFHLFPPPPPPIPLSVTFPPTLLNPPLRSLERGGDW